MKAFVGVTDGEWYELLAAQPDLDEVNFWQPSGNSTFKALHPGELFLFKLHSPNHFVVGGGVFAHSTLLPVSLAWESFGIANGVRSLVEMRRRIEFYRRRPGDRGDDYVIGCIVLTQPFFLPRASWIPVPPDWKPNIVRGRGYDLETEPGRSLFLAVEAALTRRASGERWPPAVHDAPPIGAERYGQPMLVRPRLGQGAFRVLVTDAYGRRCGVTGERVLPVLEAAHIRPYHDGGEHRVANGLLLRRDLHVLFDRGYVTVTPSLHVEVSRRIREEFENGRDYYALHGRELRPPTTPQDRPDAQSLSWHNERVFRA